VTALFQHVSKDLLFCFFETCRTETCMGMLTGDSIAVVRKNHRTYLDSTPIEVQAGICLKHCNADFCTLSSIVNFRACFNSLNS
jgi:hypothetical protein